MRSGLAAHDGRLGARAEGRAVRRRERGALHDARRAIWSTPHVVHRRPPAPGPARELHDVRHQRGQLVELLRRCRRAAPARSASGGSSPRLLERLDVRAQARDRRAQLVARVGHELALGLHGALQRVERRVEAAREPRELVAARVTSMRSDGSGSPASSSVRRVKRLIGASAVRATSAPQRRAERDPDRAHDEQHEQHPLELAVHLVERAGHLDRAAPGAGRVSTRRCVPSTVRSRELPRPSRSRAISRARAVDGQRLLRAAAGARPGRPADTSWAKPSGPPKGSGGGAGNRGDPPPSGGGPRPGPPSARAWAGRPAARRGRARALERRAASRRPRRAARRARRGRSPRRRPPPPAPRRARPRPRCACAGSRLPQHVAHAAHRVEQRPRAGLRRACGAGSRCTRAARSTPGRSRSPRRARR